MGVRQMMKVIITAIVVAPLVYLFIVGLMVGLELLSDLMR